MGYLSGLDRARAQGDEALQHWWREAVARARPEADRYPATAQWVSSYVANLMVTNRLSDEDRERVGPDLSAVLKVLLLRALEENGSVKLTPELVRPVGEFADQVIEEALKLERRPLCPLSPPSASSAGPRKELRAEPMPDTLGRAQESRAGAFALLAPRGSATGRP